MAINICKMHRIKEIIARKYAQAFINLFSDTLNLKIPEDIDKIKKFMSYLYDHRQSLFYADLKLLDKLKRQEILHELIDKFELKSEFKKLIDLLVLQQRVFLLHDILGFIVKLYLNKTNVMPFTLFSSHNISMTQEKKLIKFLESKSNKKVIIKFELDPKLIVGLKAISTELEWEHSIRQKLNLLNQT